MARFIKNRINSKGAHPGSLIFIGNQKMEKPRFRLITYDKASMAEQEFSNIVEACKAVDNQKVSWLNIDGLHDVSVFAELEKYFGFSRFTLDNLIDTGQRPKVIEDPNSLTIIAKTIELQEAVEKISVEQISFIYSDKLVISFQEKVADHFEAVRDRIRNSRGQIRKQQADYLLFALLDSLVDNYLLKIENLGTSIETLNNKLYNPDKETSNKMFHYKTELMYFRKAIRPLKEVCIRLTREHPLISNASQNFYLELSDLTEQAIESVEIYHQIIADQINTFNTNVNNKANEVMKVLSVFASIFIPLTFIAGIYGTNFSYVPELTYKYSYFIMWGVMLVVAGVMLFYFKRNKWF